MRDNKKGFTLAEVLITLGIIGVVAAITIPTLINSYKKQVLQTRIKTFYSEWTRVSNLAMYEQGGDLDTSMLVDKDNPETILEFYNVNFKSHLKTIEVLKREKGIVGVLANGSAFYIRKQLAEGDKYQSTSWTYLLFCVNAKECKEFEEGSTAYD